LGSLGHPSTFGWEHQCRNCFIAWVPESGIVTTTFTVTAFKNSATITTTVVTRSSKCFPAGKLGHYLKYRNLLYSSVDFHCHFQTDQH